MKTLAEHNEDRLEAQSALLEAQKPYPNGIECPDCGMELWDSNPMTTLTSYPAQKNVHCPSCGYTGYRIA